jgi:hypothetical protein
VVGLRQQTQRRRLQVERKRKRPHGFPGGAIPAGRSSS